MLTLKYTDIILASQSPRRQQLLSELDIPFRTLIVPNICEQYPQELSGADIPLFIARQKALAYTNILQDNSLVITADTVVLLKEEIFGKPTDKDNARDMLHKLSGNTHQVITAVCLYSQDQLKTFSCSTRVRFTRLSQPEIEYYLNKYQPYDKAGAYGVQEWIGYIGVEFIEGSYFNVMGLPIHQLYHELKNL